jgi:hypothetical protein
VRNPSSLGPPEGALFAEGVGEVMCFCNMQARQMNWLNLEELDRVSWRSKARKAQRFEVTKDEKDNRSFGWLYGCAPLARYWMADMADIVTKAIFPDLSSLQLKDSRYGQGR